MSEKKDDTVPERKPGDWTYRARRQREELRAAQEKERAEHPETRWYERTGWIVLILLIFWPIGLILTWKSSWPTYTKIGVTIAVAVLVCSVIYINPNALAPTAA